MAFAHERVVSPLAGDAVNTLQDLPVDHDSTAHPGPENQPHHNGLAGRSAKRCLRERETVRVVCHPDFPREQTREILPQRLSVEAGGIRVFEISGRRLDSAGSSDSEHAGTRASREIFQFAHHRDDLGKDKLVSARRVGFDPQAMNRRIRVPGVEDGPFDFGAAEVDAPEQPAHTETRIGMIT